MTENKIKKKPSHYEHTGTATVRASGSSSWEVTKKRTEKKVKWIIVSLLLIVIIGIFSLVNFIYGIIAIPISIILYFILPSPITRIVTIERGESK